MDETSAKAERTRLLFLWLLSSVLLVWTGRLLSGCQARKAPAAPATTTIIYADTNRVKLQHRADASAQTLTVIHAHNQNTLSAYEKSVVKFDSIVVDLR